MSSRLSLCLLLVVSVGQLGCHPEPQQARPGPISAHRADVPHAPAGQATESPREATGPDRTAQLLAQRAASFADSIGSATTRPALKVNPSGAPSGAEAAAPQLQSRRNGVSEEQIARPANLGATTPTIVPAATAPPKAVGSPIHREQAPAQAAIASGSDALARKLALRVKDDPGDLTARLDDQLLKLLEEQNVPELESLGSLPAEDREVLSALLDGLSNFRIQLRSEENMLLSKKVRPLLEMADRLRSQAELSVPTLVLCRSASAFGIYVPFDPPHFGAAKRNEIIVYTEVENFTSQLNAHKLYETRLEEEIVLYSESSGLEVWRAPRVRFVDEAHRCRRDFFMGERIFLPKTLGIGRYLLKVSVQDEQARRIAESATPLEIMAE